jgi:hypothetical protein
MLVWMAIKDLIKMEGSQIGHNPPVVFMLTATSAHDRTSLNAIQQGHEAYAAIR